MEKTDPKYDLWKHMHDQHDLLLLESELNDIIALCVPIIEEEVSELGWDSDDEPEFFDDITENDNGKEV